MMVPVLAVALHMQAALVIPKVPMVVWAGATVKRVCQLPIILKPPSLVNKLFGPHFWKKHQLL